MQVVEEFGVGRHASKEEERIFLLDKARGMSRPWSGDRLLCAEGQFLKGTIYGRVEQEIVRISVKRVAKSSKYEALAFGNGGARHCASF